MSNFQLLIIISSSISHLLLKMRKWRPLMPPMIRIAWMSQQIHKAIWILPMELVATVQFIHQTFLPLRHSPSSLEVSYPSLYSFIHHVSISFWQIYMQHHHHLYDKLGIFCIFKSFIESINSCNLNMHCNCPNVVSFQNCMMICTCFFLSSCLLEFSHWMKFLTFALWWSVIILCGFSISLLVVIYQN